MSSKELIKAPALSAEKSCKGCAFNVMGYCQWKVPPALARLYGALQAEPGTQIDYALLFENAPEVMKTGACSAYVQRQDA